MILHAGCFSERCRPALFSLSPANNDDDDDDETDHVMPRSLASLLLTVTHYSIPALNNIRKRHTRHRHSLVANRATRSSSRVYHMSTPIRFAICPAVTIVDCRSIIVFPLITLRDRGQRAQTFEIECSFQTSLDSAARCSSFCRDIFLYDTILVEYSNESTNLSVLECFDNDPHTPHIYEWTIIVLLIFFVCNMYDNCFFFSSFFPQDHQLGNVIFSTFSLSRFSSCNNAQYRALMKDESNFHTWVDARVLKSQNDVIVSASLESNLRTLALSRTSLWRLTITVSLTKHTRYHPHSGSLTNCRNTNAKGDWLSQI